jgi:hypothetical protein
MTKHNRGRQELSAPAVALKSFQTGAYPELYQLHGKHRVDITYLPDERGPFVGIDQATWGCLCDVLAYHPERTKKAQDAIIWARQVGTSGNAGTQHVSALGYDIDGTAFDDIDRRLDAFGREAIAHTTHSHHTTTGVIKQGKFEHWCKKIGIAPEINDTALRRYLVANGKGRLTNAKVLNGGQPRTTKEYAKPVHVFDFSHDPDPRARVIIPLGVPIPIGGQAGIGLDGYKNLYHAVGRRLFGEAGYDASCAHPARLMYLPAHRAGRPFDSRHYSGPLFDWRPDWDALKAGVFGARETAGRAASQCLDATPADLAENGFPTKHCKNRLTVGALGILRARLMRSSMGEREMPPYSPGCSRNRVVGFC